jgi:hypothetical protein
MCSRAQCSAGRFFGKDGIKREREREAGLDPVLHGNWEAAVAVVTRSFFFNGDFVPAGPRLESSLQCSRGLSKGPKAGSSQRHVTTSSNMRRNVLFRRRGSHGSSTTETCRTFR